MRVWVNGVLGGQLPADDPGLQRGQNVFETFRTYGRSPLGFDLHLARLQGSAELLGIEVPAGLEVELLERCEEDVVVRVMLTIAGNRAVQVSPVDPGRIGAPVRVAPVDLVLPFGFAKHGSRVFAQAFERRLGVDEVLYRDERGAVLEGSRSNLFGVVRGVLVTPPADGRILDGVTRRALLAVCEREGLPFRVDALRLQDCEEIWLSSTLKELAPVVLEGTERSGPVGRGLHRAFQAQRPW